MTTSASSATRPRSRCASWPKLAGVSNPYLSQIERGLRKPSAEILQQIAKALRISAEALYVQAGILDERYGDSDVQAAVLADAMLTERQKQVLLEIYESFRRENDENPAFEGLHRRPHFEAGRSQPIATRSCRRRQRVVGHPLDPTRTTTRKRKHMPAVPTIDAKPFYAYVGAGDAAIESLRTAVITLPEAFKAVPEQLKTVPASLKAAREQLPTQVKDLQGQFVQLQGQIAQLPLLASSLPAQVKELQATFEKRYDEYAIRGEKVVAELRGGKAKATATPAAKPAASKPLPPSPPLRRSRLPRRPRRSRPSPRPPRSSPKPLPSTPTVPAPATSSETQAS